MTIAATPPPTFPALGGAFGSAPTLTFMLTNQATVGGPATGPITIAALGAPDANQFAITGAPASRV